MGFPYVNDVLIQPILLETAMRWHIFVLQIKSCKKITLKHVLPMLASSRCDIMPCILHKLKDRASCVL
ncbi:hypothetical protein HMPREF2700_02710 [Neisseria sp. HMSC068C04]|nr:hypothetical protein HMPREF2700_02710 [Neisseria sp. HMSC068C04]